MSKSTRREDHLKALYTLGEEAGQESWVSTNAMAAHLDVKPPSVTAMVHVMSELGWAEHRPYRGARLTPLGKKLALTLVRKHRLWETFLVERLGFGWEEVHDIAEQLEHIDSVALVDKLDAYLGHPTIDPHGDPIPTATGQIADSRRLTPLLEWPHDKPCKVGAVKDSNDKVLVELTSLGIELGTVLRPEDRLKVPLALAEEVLVEPQSS
ncbi:MAG: metal-dependent transcriptional regulator [Flavobacteriales bacterium]|nr:metal-dependent transcriptional regulator [Flavobacteriales bacterium]